MKMVFAGRAGLGLGKDRDEWSSAVGATVCVIAAVRLAGMCGRGGPSEAEIVV